MPDAAEAQARHRATDGERTLPRFTRGPFEELIRGVGERGICGVAAGVANALYNATGARLREYPLTLDKTLALLPSA